MNDQLPFHRSSEYYLNDINKVLFFVEFTDPLGMISSSRIKFHVMCVEEEDSGREQGDVEVVDVNLNLVRINVHQSYCSEFRDISRRFLENVIKKKTVFV